MVNSGPLYVLSALFQNLPSSKKLSPIVLADLASSDTKIFER